MPAHTSDIQFHVVQIDKIIPRLVVFWAGDRDMGMTYDPICGIKARPNELWEIHTISKKVVKCQWFIFNWASTNFGRCCEGGAVHGQVSHFIT